MLPTVIYDIETQSLLNLKNVTTQEYITHPSTRMMSLVAIAEGTTYLWVPHNPPLATMEFDWVAWGKSVPDWLREWVDEGRTFVGHNAAAFDSPFLLHHYGLNLNTYDTMFAARASGLPGGLNRIASHMGIEGKDKEGKGAMEMLCKAKVKNGETTYPVGTPPLWRSMVEYNLQDVRVTEKIYEECKGREEPEVLAVHRSINARGIAVDKEWLGELLHLWGAVENLGADRLADLTGGVLDSKTVSSVPQVKAWLASQGVDLRSISRGVLEPMLEAPEDFFGEQAPLICEVLQLRQQLTRAMKGKLETLKEKHDLDNRLRDWAVYWGAHTGRWTGRGVQPQNLSRGVQIDVESILRGPRTLDSILRAAGEHFQADDVLVSLVRPVFCAPPGRKLVIADYATVEARGAAWLFGEDWMLSAFADPKRDIYCEWWNRSFPSRTITKACKVERNLAKVCVLGLQYGMSHRKLDVSLKRAGIDPSALGLSTEGLVETYRSGCAATAAGWKELGRALMLGVKHGYAEACHGRVVFRLLDGSHLAVRLPNGRELVYRHCRIERGVPGYCAILGLPPFETDLVRYRTQRGWDTDLYGTKLTENIVQAFCRDILAGALVRLERGDYEPTLHCHDEIVCECREEDEGVALEQQLLVMSTPPSWAPDFPLKVEGYTCQHYVKSPWSDSLEATYQEGRPI